MASKRSTKRSVNRPGKGSNLSVSPIREVRDIQAIMEYLEDRPRDYLLFVISVNSGIRTADLLRLKIGQIKGKKLKDIIRIMEVKTNKPNVIVVNNKILKALKMYFNAFQDLPDEYFVFRSQRGVNSPLLMSSVNRLVKEWVKHIGLDNDNYGCRSLRKSWGYHMRKQGIAIELIQARYNHSTPSITRRYIGITQDEVNGALMIDIG